MYQFNITIMPFNFQIRVMPDGCVRIVFSWRTTEVEFRHFHRIPWSRFDMDGTYHQYTADRRRYISICRYIPANEFGRTDLFAFANEYRLEFKRVCAAYKPALDIVETYDMSMQEYSRINA